VIALDRCDRALAAALVVLALGLAALLHQPGAVPGAFLLVVFPMGAENMVLQLERKVAFGFTYMTGALVRIGQRLAAAVSGRPRWDWFPWTLLWAGLVMGGVAVAHAWLRFAADALWITAGAALVLAVASRARPASLTS
jgi:uncharacterized membrane protein YoaK (UPF0700 family)